MIIYCRSIPTDECRASRAETSHAIIRPNRRPFRASGTRTAIGFSTAPHVFEPEVVSRPKIDNHTAIDISSGDIG